MKFLIPFFVLAAVAVSPGDESLVEEILQTTLLPAHQAALKTAEPSLRKSLEKWEESASSAAAVAEIRQLLDQPRLKIASASSLEGDWRVRSLQVSPFGATVYPFFPCRIIPEEDALIFQKPQGSQRRQGRLGRSGESEFLFLGASYFEGDPVPIYSGWLDQATEAEKEMDSVGHLYQLGTDHLIVVFAPRNGRGEVYELVK